jgi:phosphoribosylanthranilate isomerase
MPSYDMQKPRVKICCISSLEEARLAIRLGADAVGLVSEMPSGPGVIGEDLIAEIAAQVPPPVATFLLTSRKDAAGIISQQRRCGVNTIQLCDAVSSECYSGLRASLPGVSLVQVIHVTGRESIQEAIAASAEVDALLLDSGNPKLAIKQLGGTGRRHDWQISRAICEAVGVPVFLAGGLNPDNVQDAIREVSPFGLDVCSGVRAGGQLDPDRLTSFFSAVEQHQFA